MDLPTLQDFVKTIRTGTQQEIIDISRCFCPCNYVHHWIYSLYRGSWNPLVTEMDVELQGVEDEEDLYFFMLSKYDEHTKSRTASA